ncbi:MAG: hypothetical protein ACPGGG_06620 [Parvibaculales bacterium]
MIEKRHLTFKQRHGYEDLPAAMRPGELSPGFRRRLWDFFYGFLEAAKQPRYYGGGVYFKANIENFVKEVIGDYLRQAQSDINTDVSQVMKIFRHVALEAKYEDVMKFVEFVIRTDYGAVNLAKGLKELFEQQAAPCFIDLDQKPYCVVQQSSGEEVSATLTSLEAVKEAGFDSSLTHLRSAAEHLNGGRYRDSIRDSIHAVEAIARKIEPSAKTLGDALNPLEEKGIIGHSALKTALSKLYGYTSDEGGIRHAELDDNDSNIGLHEAMFFYSACAAFAGYLANKERELNRKDG